jgi:hypothetical protein
MKRQYVFVLRDICTVRRARVRVHDAFTGNIDGFRMNSCHSRNLFRLSPLRWH